MKWKEILNLHTENINKNLKISVFEVEKLNIEIQKLLDENLIAICEGKYSSSDIVTVKKRIKKLFNNKDDKWKMGAIAEFFIHLYMNLSGYSQDCMFFNLEENSIKKGFDGYFNLDDNCWIMESKSGSILTKNITHKSKLIEAIDDLSDKFEGRANNNPWQNAYNHASHCDVGTPSNIRNSIKKLSEDYTQSKFHNKQDFNIIPCATIFLDTTWNPQKKNDLANEVKAVINNLRYKNIHLICVTQGNITIFNNYINK